MKMTLKWLYEIVAARKILQEKGSILTVKMDFPTQSLAKDLLLHQDGNYTSEDFFFTFSIFWQIEILSTI